MQGPPTKIQVIYAGGTISSFARPPEEGGYREGGHFVDLVAKLIEHKHEIDPDFGRTFNENFHVDAYQTAYLGLSENINRTDLEGMEAAIERAMLDNSDAIIMSFGTDFANQAGRIFQTRYGEQLRKKGMKLIIVSANHDLSFPGTDAWDNLEFSFSSARYSEEEPGVYLAFHGKLILGDRATKEPFNGVEMNFMSTDDPRYESAVRERKRIDDTQIDALKALMPRVKEGKRLEVLDYPVNVFRDNHQDLLDRLEGTPVDAVLLILYHSGTANTTDSDASVSRLVETLRNKGIVVFGATENGEPVDLHSYETSVRLREVGVVPLFNMHREVALAKLEGMEKGHTSTQLITEMLRDFAGEIDVNRVREHLEDIDKLIDLYAA